MTLPSYFNIIPVKDKKPLVRWQDFTDRVQTVEEKADLMKINPNGKIGIVCGPVSRILVLDDDGGLDGNHYIVPKTWTAKTPRGGTHYYFQWVPDLDNKVTTKVGILDKVDVRGQGGYVVHYGWSFKPAWMVKPAKPPKWLIDLLPDKTSTAIQNTKVQMTLTEIKEGNRNASFTSLAGSLRARGYKVEEIFDLLKPKAKEVGFYEQELWTVCQSVGRYEPSHAEGQGQAVDAFLADQMTIKWICEPFIAEQAIGFIAGLPESRKSWILIDLAVECAKGGGLWLNKFPVKGAKVLLIDQERSKGEVQRRLQAVIAGKELNVRDISSTLFVRSGTSTRIDLQNSYDSLRKELTDIRPEMILVDSFATFHTKEESNRMEIQQVLERIKALRNEFKCAILLIHHCTKQAFQNKLNGQETSYLDMAGNVAIPAAAETVLNIVKHDEDSSFVHHTKSTQGPKAAPFLVKVVDLDASRSQIKIEAY